MNDITQQLKTIKQGDIQARVKLMNSIKKLYPELRQSSKNITFSSTYGGTYHTIHKNLGVPLEQAKQIEQRYKELYKASIAWVNNKLLEACDTGFVELAFGLKLKTPFLKEIILNNSKTPNLASAEARTAGNALGQSYGMLNNRACAEFMKEVRKSDYRLLIRPVAQIHDACYFIVKNDVEVIKFTNDNLIKAMSWQEDPKIQHDIVKIEAELSIFYPDWSQECKLPNYCSQEVILDKFHEHFNNLKKEN